MSWKVRQGDALARLREMPDESVHCCVTSPPYFGLRDYGVEGQIGLEASLDEYLARLVEVFAEARRVLRTDGTLWLNIGDSYAGSWGAQSREATSQLADRGVSAQQIVAHPKQTRTGSIPAAAGYKPKDLIGVPWSLAFALRADGWYLRSEIIWHKRAPMPSSATDRPTVAHEQMFLLSRSPRYHYDGAAITEPAKYDGPNGAQHSPYAQGFGRRTPEQEAERREKRRSVLPGGNGAMSYPARTANKRSVWTLSSEPFAEAHFATFPTKLIEPCILAGCPEGGTVLDPFAGASTTGVVATRLDRSYIGIELNPAYVEMGRRRIRDDAPLLNTPIEAAS